MNKHYYVGKRKQTVRKAVKLHTVNVVEITNGNEVQGVSSFSDTPEGNKQAEKLFKRLVKEYESQDKYTVPSDAEDMQNYLNDGVFDVVNYQILLTHSI